MAAIKKFALATARATAALGPFAAKAAKMAKAKTQDVGNLEMLRGVERLKARAKMSSRDGLLSAQTNLKQLGSHTVQRGVDSAFSAFSIAKTMVTARTSSLKRKVAGSILALVFVYSAGRAAPRALIQSIRPDRSSQADNEESTVDSSSTRQGIPSIQSSDSRQLVPVVPLVGAGLASLVGVILCLYKRAN